MEGGSASPNFFVFFLVTIFLYKKHGVSQLPNCILRGATGNWRRQPWQHFTCRGGWFAMPAWLAGEGWHPLRDARNGQGWPRCTGHGLCRCCCQNVSPVSAAQTIASGMLPAHPETVQRVQIYFLAIQGRKWQRHDRAHRCSSEFLSCFEFQNQHLRVDSLGFKDLSFCNCD